MPANDRREAVQRRMNKIKQRQATEEREILLKKLDEVLAKDDQGLQSIPEKEWEDMNLDDPDEGPNESKTESTPPAASSQGESSGATEESPGAKKSEGVNENKEHQDEAGKNNKESKTENKKSKERESSIRPSIESEDGGSESSLFVSNSNSESDSASHSDSDDESGLNFDPDLGKSLYTFPAAKASKSGETVGWTGRGTRSVNFINRYGKKGAAIYRLERFAFSQDYEENPPIDQCFSMTRNRYGDTKNENDKLVYTRRHILDIFGVAWKTAGPNPSRRDLDLIDPSMVSKWGDVPTKILIAWKIGEDVKKTWETRQSLRVRWGVKEADELIFKAAQKAQDRYEESQTGKRLAKSKSPSVGLVRDDVERHREKSLGKQRSSPSRSSPRARSQSPQLDANTLESLKVDFLANFLELSSVSDFGDLSRKQQRDCIAAWKAEKAALIDGVA